LVTPDFLASFEETGFEETLFEETGASFLAPGFATALTLAFARVAFAAGDLDVRAFACGLFF